VAKIVGPGNAYVAAAKRQVFGTVGIDMIAGPSESAGDGRRRQRSGLDRRRPACARPSTTSAQSILITDDADFGERGGEGGGTQLEDACRAPRRRAASWRDFGAVIACRTRDEAPPIANRIAAEHLELACR
jgi:histidinol dehydrogenase